MVIQPIPSNPELPKVDLAPEQVVSGGEAIPETAAENAADQASEQADVQDLTPPPAAPVADAAVVEIAPAVEKSENLVQIEGILSEGLSDLYQQLPDKRKEEFKQKGEETARSIEKILMVAKFHAQKIVKLIVSWLKMIPGVNKFFLEQDSKIKTDKLIELKKEKGL